MKRRTFLKAGAAALALPGLVGRAFAQQPTQARRLIIFYFPDGIVGRSADGEGSLWHPSGGEFDFRLSEQLEPLTAHRDRCVFFRGLQMGPADNGSHPGGAKKLLTAVDGGNGESIDQVLARTVGADAPHRHLYLGAMANENNASGDKHISYPAAGRSVPPEDDPVRAFERLFSGAGAVQDGPDPEAARRRRRRLSVLDTLVADLGELRGRLDGAEQARLGLHLDAIRELERRTEALAEQAVPMGDACRTRPASVADIQTGRLYAPEQFPNILRAQTELMVTAMACGLSKVGVIQGSHHTSELIMSRFADTEMHDPGFDMRSHQASHYGPRHDRGHREFSDYLKQRRWWVRRFADLLEQLEARPEGEGTMLDHSVVLLCSEVADGNTHQHFDMPFVLAGGPFLRTGRLADHPDAPHAALLAGLARALGADLDRFGQANAGPLPGLFS